MSPSSPIDLSKFSAGRRALRNRLRAESEAAAVRADEAFVRDRAAHEALAARDRTVGAVRLGEQRLARDRAAGEAADAEFERVFPGSSCPCSRCSNERRSAAARPGRFRGR